MKLNIHQKVLMLVLGSGLAAFLVLGLFAFCGRGIVRSDMQDMSIELGDNSAKYTENLLIDQLKDTLGELAEARAQFLDREMAITREDSEILAQAMTDIMSRPEDHLPQTLIDPRTSPVKMGEPYLIYAPDMRDKITPEIQRDIAVASNIKDFLADILKTYDGYNATAFVGSKDGWFICAGILHDAGKKTDFNANLTLNHDRVYNFDTRKRPWYIAAANAKHSVILDPYRTVETSGESSYQQIGASAPFYDAQGNFLGVVGLDCSTEDFYKFINTSSTGKDTINFVLNGRGKIIFSSQSTGALAVDNSGDDLVARAGGHDLRKSSMTELAAAAQKMVAGEQGVAHVTLDGENFYLAFAPMEMSGWSFGMLVTEEEVLKTTESTHNYFLQQIADIQDKMLREYSYVNGMVVGIPVALLIILVLLSMNLSRRFVKPIHELSDGVRDIASGNLDKKLDIHTDDEIEHLATCFNAMTDELKTYMANLTKVTAERERIATELDVATEIQRGMLPKDFPVRSDCELYATMTPAKEVGGDFYDFYMLDETHLAVTVADVSGKGIAAALFMVVSKTVLNNFAESFYKQNGLAPVVTAANEQLCANNDAMMFVTAFVGVLDLESGEFTYVNAGHNPPVIYHAAENHCDFLDVKKNFVLGPMDGIPFVEQKITLKPGDLLFLYTDGVTEALNVEEEEYLPDRLIAFMNSTDCRVDLQTLIKNVCGDLSAHVGDAAQSDDITMFALRFKGGDKT